MELEFSHRTRSGNIAALALEPVELLVIGAGITGAGIARDAAMRGLRTALIDKGDFGAGTSSRSSRLVHGGLRYLEESHFKFVLAGIRERHILLKIAPHLVWPRSFLVPLHRGGRISIWRLAAGLWLHDLMAAFRNVGHHRLLSRRAIRAAEPRMKDRDLIGGARYYDAQCDDARLTLATVRSAHRHGALAANYVQVDRLDTADGRVRGALVTDLTTGQQHTIRALAVVNATGPWSDTLRGQEGAAPVLRPTKGVHISVPRQRIGNKEAVTFLSPIDGRVMFIIPHGRLSYIGTTDTDCDYSPDEIYAEDDDVIYLLRSANALFPDARLGPADIVSTWTGVRPLVAPANRLAPSSICREHRILDEPSGLISVVGGRLTTYRAIAAQTVDRVVAQLHELDGRHVRLKPGTEREPLPGGEAHDLEVLVEEAEREGFSREMAEHLVRSYGSESPAVTRLAISQPELAEPVSPGHSAILAELVHAMRREMAITQGDLLIRRTHVFHEVSGHGIEYITRIADLATAEMGWDPERKEAEIAAYRAEAEVNSAFHRDMEEMSAPPSL